jgi:hypothetical protein
MDGRRWFIDAAPVSMSCGATDFAWPCSAVHLATLQCWMRVMHRSSRCKSDLTVLLTTLLLNQFDDVRCGYSAAISEPSTAEEVCGSDLDDKTLGCTCIAV